MPASGFMPRKGPGGRMGRMNGAMHIAAAGINAANAAFARSASQVVRAATTGTDGTLPRAIVGMTTNSLAMRADIAVFKMADQSMGTLLNILV